MRASLDETEAAVESPAGHHCGATRPICVMAVVKGRFLGLEGDKFIVQEPTRGDTLDLAAVVSATFRNHQEGNQM